MDENEREFFSSESAIGEVEEQLLEDSITATPGIEESLDIIEFVEESNRLWDDAEVVGESNTWEPIVHEEPSYKFEYSSLFENENEEGCTEETDDTDATTTIQTASTTSGARPTVVKPTTKRCAREKMRKWLQKDRQDPTIEGFLGGGYFQKKKDINREPCHRFGNTNIHLKPAIEGLNEIRTKGRLCSCKISISKIDEAKAVDELKNALVNQQNVTSVQKPTCSCRTLTERVTENSKISSTIKDDKDKNVQNEWAKRHGIGDLRACDCQISKSEYLTNTEMAENELERVQKRRYRLHRKLWTKYDVRKCKCDQSTIGRSKPCICENMAKKRKQLQVDIMKLGEEETEKRIILMETKVREEKIDKLFAEIGPDLAREYRELSAKCKKKQKTETNAFVERGKKEFGTQLREFRSEDLRNGTVHQEYDRDDHQSLQYIELPNGSCYYGQFSPLGMEGKCLYKMAHGPIYVGSIVDGKMEGPGKLMYPNGGILEGIWVNGTLFAPKYVFYDGLKFEPTNWKYCRIPDRRFVSEIMNGMSSPDNVHLCPNHPGRQIPKNCLDAGEGFYDPQQKVIIHPCTGKIVRIVGELEANWIVQHCRRERFEEVPFSRYMHENWYAGTVFPLPDDEPEWFHSEFPQVVLPYTTVDDVLEARKLAMNVSDELKTTTQTLIDKNAEI